MEDPRQCKVDVSTLTGLSAAQQAALKTIYAPTRAGSEIVFPGQPFGGEGEAAGWPAWISGATPRDGQPAAPSLRYAFGTQLFKYLVFSDPEWDYRRYDLSTWKKDTARIAADHQRDQPRPRRVQVEGAQAACSGTAGRMPGCRRSARSSTTRA